MAGDGLGVGGGVELEVGWVVSLLGGLRVVLGHGGRWGGRCVSLAVSGWWDVRVVIVLVWFGEALVCAVVGYGTVLNICLEAGEDVFWRTVRRAEKAWHVEGPGNLLPS